VVQGSEVSAWPGDPPGLQITRLPSQCVQCPKPQFRGLLFRRAEPHFYAFDALWDEHAWSDDERERRRFRSGEDLPYLPLSDRGLRLRALVRTGSERLLTAITSLLTVGGYSTGVRARF
jgi:hypothetical protein